MFESSSQKRVMLSALLVLMAALTYLSAEHMTLEIQAISAWTLVVFLWLLKKNAWSQTLSGRVFFLSIVFYLSWRYVLWRTFDTLVYINLIEFIFMALLFLAELEVALVHFMGMFSNAWPKSEARKPPLPNNEADYPDVDVFVPTYNEPEEVIKTTLTACKALRYPKEKLHIHLLDDGGTQAKRDHPTTGSIAWNRYYELRVLCHTMDVNYITRDKNERAKAGNINNALGQTSAELILFLDCDHVPTQDFLEYTVGHFLQNKKLFLVQTPHFFINPDPIEKNLHTFHKAPSENEMFFRATHPGINLWNASFFCGSAAIMRREALEKAGGFQGESITEDAETSLDLHADGWESLFVDKPLVCGLSPETFSDFIVQRSRWCQGMLQIGFLKNPLKMPGLKWPQRICYSSFYLYWFFGFARVMFFIAPTLFLLFDLRVYHASSAQVLAYAIPHLFASILATDLLYGKYRWPFFSELYESVQSIFLLRPVFSVIANPHKPKFKVTPKGTHLDHDFLNPLATPFYLMFTLMVAAFVSGVVRWLYQPHLQDVIVLCMAWLALGLIIALASLGTFWERHQTRHFHRAWARGAIKFALPTPSAQKQTYSAKLTDLSLSGLGFSTTEKVNLVTGQQLTIYASDSYGNAYKISGNIKRIKNDPIQGNLVGVEFLNQEEEFEQLVSLVYGDSQRWQQFWQRPSKHPGPLGILSFFIRMGISGAKLGLIGSHQLLKEKIAKIKPKRNTQPSYTEKRGDIGTGEI